MKNMLHLKFSKAALLLLFIGLAIYLNSLGNGFVWDDKYLVEDNQLIRSLTHLKDIFTRHLFYFARVTTIHYYRPLQALSYCLDYRIWGLNPFGYHLTNVLLHIANSVLIFYLVLTISLKRNAAFLAGIFFLAHPLHNAAVSYVSGRADLIVVFLILSSLLAFAKYLSGGQRQFVFYLFSVALFFLSGFAKENALISVILLSAVCLLSGKAKGAKGAANPLLLVIPFAIIGGVFTAHNLLAEENIFQPLGYASVSWMKLFTWLKIVFIYLGLIIFPLNLHMERATKIITSFSDPLIPLLAFGAIAAAALMIIEYRRSRLSFFGLSWFWVALVPVFFSMYSNPVFLNSGLCLMAEHWLYLPLIGLAIFVASEVEIICERLWGSARVAVNSILILFIVFYGLQAVKMNRVWRGEESLYKNTLKYAPYSYRPYVLLGQLFLKEGRIDEAIAIFRQALASGFESSQIYAYSNLGMAYEAKKDMPAAIKAYEKAIEANSLEFYAHNNLGVIYAKAGQIEKAKEEWRMALESNPNFDLAYRNLLLTYKDDKTISRLQAMLEKDASNPDLNRELAAYYLSQGLFREAIEVLNRCLGSYHDDGKAFNMLGFIYIRLKYYKQAQIYFKEAIRVSPRFIEAYNNLGALYVMTGKLRQAKAIWEEALKIDPNASLIRDNLRNLDGMNPNN